MSIVTILSILIFIIPLLWLALILAYWFKTREFNLKLIKYGILTVIALYVLQGSYFTIATYNAWKLDPISQYLLPPSSSINYFLGYAYFHFWRESIVSVLMGMVWAGFLFLINRYSGGRFLEKSEIALAFFTAMIVGWPKVFAYFALAFVFLILKGVINAIVFKDKSSIAIVSSLAFSALIVAGFGNFLMKLPFFDNLKL